MKKYNILVKNTGLFALGNIGSKLVTILLVPLYTYYLSTSEYGEIDILVTTISLLIPIISLSIYDGVLRFAMDSEKNKIEILNHATTISIIGLIIFGTILLAIKVFFMLDFYFFFLFFIIALQMFLSIFIQYARATSRLTIYAVDGVLVTLTLAVSNIIFLVFLGLGVNGYFWGMIISYAVGVVFLLITIKEIREVRLVTRNIRNSKIFREMIAYSLPLIPNSILWWIMSASSRYFLLYFEGTSANGLYAVANKIPTILTIFTFIFTQAWQLSAIEEYSSDNQEKSTFFSNVFLFFQTALFLASAIILAFIKPILHFAVSSDYFLSWELVAPLIFAALFSSFSGFVGSNYLAAKRTKGVMLTSLLGGAISIGLSVLLLPLCGPIGAAISTAIAFFFVWMVRIKDTTKFVFIKYDYMKITLSILVLLCQTGIMYLQLLPRTEILVNFIFFVILALIYTKELKLLIKYAISVIRKRGVQL